MKPSTLIRCLSKAIDMCVIFLLSVVLPYPVGVLLGFLYTLTHDGIMQQSLGKRIFHLKVLHTTRGGKPITIRESMIRNAPLGVATFFAIIPFWGWIILVLLGVPLVAMEVYLMMTSPTGSRLGDVMADTKVVELSRSDVDSD